jgi:VWFA-related protein
VCAQLVNGTRVRAFRQPNPTAPIARIVAPLAADALTPRPAIDNGRRRLLAAFALELAAPGSLRQASAAARLVEWACELNRGHAPADAFDRAWQLAALSVLEGGIDARALEAHVDHALPLLPDEPRLTLARAIVEEQSTAPAESLAGQASMLDALRATYLLKRTTVDHARSAERAISLFRRASAADTIGAEASLRMGHVQLGMDHYDDALASLSGIEPRTRDLALIYLTHLFRGLAYDGLGRSADARASYTRALEISPGAHSATMRQAALAYRDGRRDDADALLAKLLADDDPGRDPWWAYYAADWRFWYPRIDTVRAMLRDSSRAAGRPAPRPRLPDPSDAAIVPARQEQIFRSRSDVVTIQAAVKSGNRPVGGLTTADFALTDNGVAQTINSLSIEKVPLDLTLLLDLSSSVDGRTLDRLKAAVRDTTALLRPDDRFRLIAISQVLNEIVPLQPPGDRLPLELLTAQGATSLYDGLAAAMMRPTDPGRRQLVLAFSDGHDSTSIIDDRIAQQIARLTDTVVDIVVPVGPNAPATVDPNVVSSQVRGGQRPTAPVVTGTPEELAARAQALKPWARQETVPAVLPALVAPTAGQVFTFTADESISSVFKRTLDDFRAAYVLQYVPQGVAREGWHDVAVAVTKAGKYDVRARKGYSGGPADWSKILGSELIR